MTTKQEQLKAAALRAGLIDLDALALMSKDDGTKSADELVAAKAAKPHLFQPKKAKDMSETERQEWLREHKRRFG
jgi:hypothetical protein